MMACSMLDRLTIMMNQCLMNREITYSFFIPQHGDQWMQDNVLNIHCYPLNLSTDFYINRVQPIHTKMFPYSDEHMSSYQNSIQFQILPILWQFIIHQEHYMSKLHCCSDLQTYHYNSISTFLFTFFDFLCNFATYQSKARK